MTYKQMQRICDVPADTGQHNLLGNVGTFIRRPRVRDRAGHLSGHC